MNLYRVKSLYRVKYRLTPTLILSYRSVETTLLRLLSWDYSLETTLFNLVLVVVISCVFRVYYFANYIYFAYIPRVVQDGFQRGLSNLGAALCCRSKRVLRARCGRGNDDHHYGRQSVFFERDQFERQFFERDQFERQLFKRRERTWLLLKKRELLFKRARGKGRGEFFRN